MKAATKRKIGMAMLKGAMIAFFAGMAAMLVFAFIISSIEVKLIMGGVLVASAWILTGVHLLNPIPPPPLKFPNRPVVPNKDARFGEEPEAPL